MTPATVSHSAPERVLACHREGLPLAIGEPAINPAPRQMIEKVITEVADTYGGNGNVVVTISVEGGAALALKTWNPRLVFKVVSHIGTTGVVVPILVLPGSGRYIVVSMSLGRPARRLLRDALAKPPKTGARHF